MKRGVSNSFPPLRARLPGIASAIPDQPVSLAHETWPAFWREAQRKLLHHGYARATLVFYRHVLRSFSRHVAKPPRRITADDVRAYLGGFSRERCTWHWTAMNLSVLRTLFDKLGGLQALNHRRGPRRKQVLPDYLNRSDISRMMDAALCLRDQMLIALLYGCGLKTSELRRLTWGDIDAHGGTVRVASRWKRPDRQLPIPEAVRTLLMDGRARC
ncbi:MAG TPA: tyrosine-type recombinase/integrase, partial [Kiritimatiellia bacterium]|nr:tyrosine-type recombinase/integrase [Kiritimatiellia bacterium]HMP00422.1 tyrosine-type recombinase/integrase [Kiritimatiellia bacterium]HMP98102.1 tyrosine-type recombinase/integrase [Kiritimatiellia bacterium]